MIDPVDHVAIIQLYEDYNHTIDTGAAHAWSATFTLDGVFYHPVRTWRGEEELLAFFEQRESSLRASANVELKHWNSNIIIEGDDKNATATCELLVSGIRSQDAHSIVVARGRYQDRLVRTDQGWRFLERRLCIS
ncbi:nuclear transport factor 2 family protein [Pseudomonas fluorescens]|uniref:SnoaL-like domain-containing protein n=1 Tax=Pseudomonas fluorescens TaxID=294 RepID=A0A5E7CG54_PSEFL|nr:nuclear transport factor 2 family protein [Pseudomonas fluorescens]VVO03436.1 hypothetical protein PS833_02847 [Pseudomonas fluorescens]